MNKERDTIESQPDAEPAIRGAEAIAEFIFGDRNHRRKVYYLATRSKLPIYRLGSTLMLRPSAYRNWIKQQETASVNAVTTAH